MFVSRPRQHTLVRAEEVSGQDTHHLLMGGSADALMDDLSEADWRTARAERRAALARKRPAGFAPWPEEVK